MADATLTKVIMVNMISDGSCCYPLIGYHQKDPSLLWSFFPQTHNLKLMMRETSDRPKLKDVLENT